MLIDEIDLYLRPQWQILRDLHANFPEVQFIVSSHSPADIKKRMDLFYTHMDENNYKESDKVLIEVEAIVGTTDPDIAAARISLDLERILEE